MFLFCFLILLDVKSYFLAALIVFLNIYGVTHNKMTADSLFF